MIPTDEETIHKLMLALTEPRFDDDEREILARMVEGHYGDRDVLSEIVCIDPHEVAKQSRRPAERIRRSLALLIQDGVVRHVAVSRRGTHPGYHLALVFYPESWNRPIRGVA